MVLSLNRDLQRVAPDPYLEHTDGAQAEILYTFAINVIKATWLGYDFVKENFTATVSPVMILQINIRTFVINVIKAAWLGYDFVKENITATVSSVMILQMKIRTFVINVINHKTATWPTPLL